VNKLFPALAGPKGGVTPKSAGENIKQNEKISLPNGSGASMLFTTLPTISTSQRANQP
jgi:hypothetical protein